MLLPKKARIAHSGLSPSGSKTNRRGYLTPPVIIVLAIIVLFVALSLYLNAKIFSKPQPTPNPTPTAQASPKLSADETANWRTYVHKDLRFSVKYPPEVAIRKVSNSGVEFSQEEDIKKDLIGINALLIYERGEPGISPEEAFKNSDCPKPCDEMLDEVTINNAFGIKTLGPGYPDEHNYYLSNRSNTSKVVRLYLSLNSQEQNVNTDMLVKMMSTFKFLD